MKLRGLILGMACMLHLFIGALVVMNRPNKETFFL